MVLTFRDYQSVEGMDFNKMGQINESHQYSESICSVMDKLTFYVKRSEALSSSNLNESAKRIYDRDIRFNRNEKIAVACIFNEMLKQYEDNMKSELSLCEAIINHGNLLEEGVEYDYETLAEMFSITEGVGDWVKKKLGKAAGTVKVAAKNVFDGAKDITVKSVEVIKAKQEDLVAWAKQAKEDFEEKYTAFKELIENIVKKGVDSIKAFIDKLLEVFTSIGDNMVDAVKKFGGLKMDKDEKPAELSGIEAENLYANAGSPEEKSFINHIILRAEAILSKDKDNAAKLMTESYLEESIVDNKFIAWLAGYKENGEKMSWWKCILIGLCASLIVWMLPKLFTAIGLGAALTAFIAALVGVIWNGIGLLKLIYKRNKERKPGEKFFNKTTAIFFAVSIFSMVFSLATFLKTVGPFMREICNHFGWTGDGDMSKFGEFFFNLTKKISPKDCFNEGSLTTVTEDAKNFGGDVRGTGGDVIGSKDAAMKLLNDMPGATDAQKKAAEQFLDAAIASKGSSGVYKALEAFKDNKDLPFTSVFDTSKWGGSGPIAKAIETLKASGKISDAAILGTVGSEATSKASGGVYGFASYIMGASKEESDLIFKTAAEIAGKDAGMLQIHSYGSGVIEDIIGITEPIKGSFDVLAPNVPFLPMVMPFFDKKKWGDYKMRFASATRGSAAYVVDHVEMMPGDKIEGDGSAIKTLKDLHNKAWGEYQSLTKKAETVEEGLFHKKDKKEDEESKENEEPQYIVFFIRADEKTGKKEDEIDSKKDKGEKPEIAMGVAIDTLTMMCADVCNFNGSVDIRKRPQPYFMKGLLSRLSFRPVKDNDNETKEYIRKTLGQTMHTLVQQNVLYGMGKKYIDSKIDGDKGEFKLRETILGNDKQKINGDKEVFELGNFTPNELLQCIQDTGDSHKVAYDFLGGEFGSNVSIKKDENGNIKSASVRKNDSTIENLKYYRVSKNDHDDVLKKYKENVKTWENGGKIGKKPSKPQFIKGDDDNYYKRASKKFINDNKTKTLYDFVDIRITPLLKKGELHDKLVDDKNINNVLFKDDKLNKDVITVLKPFLFRPEKTFAKDDENDLAKQLKDKAGVEGEKLGWFKNLFKDEEQLHDTFKKMVEIIWDYLSEKKRSIFKNVDFNKNHKNEGVEYTSRFDYLIEEFYAEDYDEECEYKYDTLINENKGKVLLFEDFLMENE